MSREKAIHFRFGSFSNDDEFHSLIMKMYLKRFEAKWHLMKIHLNFCVYSSRTGVQWWGSGQQPGPLTPALSLVGRGAVEDQAPQVMLHMACSLLRCIKCQLWNHLKDQRSVFLIRPAFWGSSLPFTALPTEFNVAYFQWWTKWSVKKHGSLSSHGRGCKMYMEAACNSLFSYKMCSRSQLSPVCLLGPIQR